MTVSRAVNLTSVVLLILLGAWTLSEGSVIWVTPDQRGSRLLQRGDAEGAARAFEDPFLKGVAEFRSGDFKASAATFSGVQGANSMFNQANARVMLGEYERAIELYEMVLESEPEFEAAAVNLEIAKGRYERVRDKGGQMTGGMLGADEIVFDQDGPNKSSDEGDEVVVSEMGDQEMRGLWLREVQTTPSQFLKTKFNFQLARKDTETEGDSANEGGRR